MTQRAVDQTQGVSSSMASSSVSGGGGGGGGGGGDGDVAALRQALSLQTDLLGHRTKEVEEAKSEIAALGNPKPYSMDAKP